MNSISATLTRQVWPIALLIFWPFVFLFPYTFNLIGIGNDFHYLYYVYKHYLLSMLHSGVFPLWSPTEGCGYPFFSNPFTQAFYPLNAVYYAYFVIMGRFAPWDYALFTILALSILSVGLFLWLKMLRLGTGPALTAALCASMSLKATELLRFPNAIHAAAWLPWLLLGLTLVTTRKRGWLGCAVFGVALLMHLTAGYPYFIIYAIFLLGPYTVAMLFGPSRRALGLDIGEDWCGPRRYFLRVGGSALFAGALTSPMLLNMQALMAETVDRGTPNFNYATGYLFGPRETIGAWLFPPVSSMEGWYYFGILTTLLLGHQLLCSAMGRLEFLHERPLMAVVWPWVGIVMYFIWGKDSVLFTWVWHNVGVLDQMRVWGRMNVILVPIISLLLARAIQSFLRFPDQQARKGSLGTMGLFVTLWLTVMLTQIHYLRLGEFDGYWPLYFKGLPGGAYAQMEFPYIFTYNYDEKRFLWCSFGLGAFLLLMLLYRFSGAQGNRLLRFFPATLVALTAGELFVLSVFQWTSPAGNPNESKYDSFALLQSEKAAPRHLFSGEILSNRIFVGMQRPQYGVGVIPNWGFQRHASTYGQYIGPDAGGYARAWKADCSEAERLAVARFYGSTPFADRLFFSQSISHRTIPSFLNDVDEFTKESRTVTRTLHYDGNQLRASVYTDRQAWLTFVDNWDHNWTAIVNGAPAPISLCLGSYKAISVPKGESEVEFVYRPRFWPRKTTPLPPR